MEVRKPTDISGIDLETKAVVVSSTGDDNDIAKIIGLTGTAVKLLIQEWATYRDKGWIRHVVIPPTKRPGPTPITLMENYMTAMKDQVDAIAALHHALLLASLGNQPNIPAFSDPLEKKLEWWLIQTSVDRVTVLGWIHAGVNSQGVEKIE